MMYEFHRNCEAPPGAILALTSSADKEAAEDIGAMEEYIVEHAEAIYRHANNLRALGEKESLYIITGCIKSASWAMAAYDANMDPKHSTLRLIPVPEAMEGDPPKYEWRSQGSSWARVGRSDNKRVNDQSLFLQGFKLASSSQFRSRVKANISRDDDSEASGGAKRGADDRSDPSGPPETGSRSGGKERNFEGEGTTLPVSQSRFHNDDRVP